jgi:hypothetical protein
VLPVMLFHPWNMFCTLTLALSIVWVQCTIWLFIIIIIIIIISTCHYIYMQNSLFKHSLLSIVRK